MKKLILIGLAFYIHSGFAAVLSGVLYDATTRTLAQTNLTIIGLKATNIIAAPGGNGSSNSVTALDQSGNVKMIVDKDGGMTVGSATHAGAGNAIITGTLTLAGTNIQTTLSSLQSQVAAGGTVSSVAMTVPAEWSVSGSPITTSGTFAITKVSQAQNLFMASPNGSSGLMVPRAIVPADLPATLGPFSVGDIPYADTTTSIIGGYEMLSGNFHIPKTNAVVVSGSTTNGWRSVIIDGGDVTTVTNLPGLLVRMKNDNASGTFTNVLFWIDDSQQSSLTTSRIFALQTKSRGTVFDVDATGAIYGASGHVTGVMTADGGFSGNSALVSGTGTFNKISTASVDTTSAGSRTAPALSLDSTHSNAGWYGFNGGWRFANYVGLSGSDTREVLAIGGAPDGGIIFSSTDGISWSNNSTNIDQESAVASIGMLTNGVSIGNGTTHTNSSGSIHAAMGNFTNLIGASGKITLNGIAWQWPSSHATTGYLLKDADGAGTIGYVDPSTLGGGGGGGTVTSVSMTVPTGLSVSGSPVTGSGTLAITRPSGGMDTGDGTIGVIPHWNSTTGGLTDGYMTESGGFLFPSTNIGAFLGSNTNWLAGVFTQAKNSSSNSFTWRDSSGVVKGNIGPAGGLTVKDGTQTTAGNIEASSMHTTGVMTADSGFSGNSAVISGSIFSTSGGINIGGGSNPGTGNLLFAVAGGKMTVTSGSNQRAGNTTLAGGTSAVSNTTVSANTVVIWSRKTAGGTLGNITYTLSAGSSFTLTSDSATDTSVISYFLIEVP